MSFINTIREDIKTVQAQDPAAQNGLVIFLSYPGLHAKWNHVPEHWLWEHGHRSLARVLSQITRHITGVEIHPAAQIGKHFFIDHAMGVVIGETTIVGDNCVLYQASRSAVPATRPANATPPWATMSRWARAPRCLATSTLATTSKSAATRSSSRTYPTTAPSWACRAASSSATAAAYSRKASTPSSTANTCPTMPPSRVPSTARHHRECPPRQGTRARGGRAQGPRHQARGRALEADGHRQH